MRAGADSVGKSPHKAILPSIVSSQQSCEVYFISLTVVIR